MVSTVFGSQKAWVLVPTTCLPHRLGQVASRPWASGLICYMKMTMSSLSECRGLGPLFSLGERTSPGEGGLERKGIQLSFLPPSHLPSCCRRLLCRIPCVVQGPGRRAGLTMLARRELQLRGLAVRRDEPGKKSGRSSRRS